MPYHLADARSDAHEFLETPWLRAPKEVGCALSASLLVSPLVSIIDKAMVQPVTGATQFMKAVGSASGELVKQPKAFFNGISFRLTTVVYFGTYAAANLSELYLDRCEVLEEKKRRDVKVGSASVANIGLLAWRDSIFAREFTGGNIKPKTTPPRTISMFAMRDCATMFATFYLAPKAGHYLIEEHGMNRHAAEISTAIAVPVLTQILTAPIHIHAMDYYSRPVVSTGERLETIKNEFGKVSFARGLRILPAFGIGSYVNNKFRELLIRQSNEDLLLSRKVTKIIEKQAKLMKKMTYYIR